MQNYLSFCYEREKKTKKKDIMIENLIKPCQEKRRACAGEMIRQIVAFACVIILAMAVCAVNDYDKMYGFVEMTGEAARGLEAED